MTGPARWVRFNVVGALGIAVQLGTIAGVDAIAHLPPAVSTGVGVAAAIAHNFAWHRHWTWRDRTIGSIGRTWMRFALANGVVSLLGNVLVVQVLVGRHLMPLVGANVAAIAICGLANYALGDRVVFAPPANAAGPVSAVRSVAAVVRT